MPVTVGGSVGFSVNLSDLRTGIVGSLKEQGSRAISLGVAWAISSGTGVGQGDKIWGDTRTPPGGGAGGTDVIDFATVLTNAFGAVETFVKVKGVFIVAAPTNTTTLQIARPAANGSLLFVAVSDALAPFGAGGGFAWFDPISGFSVTVGTADLLNVVNSAGGVAGYDVAVIGTSA